MGITKTTMEKLPAAERAEVEAILQEFAGQKMQFTAHYMSDAGDTLVWYGFLGLVALVGLVAGVMEDVPTSLGDGFEFGIGNGISWFVRDPIGLAFVAAALVLPWSLVTIARAHDRCGWAVTSFGVLRIFGTKLKLLRFADVARAARRKVQTRRPFSVLELTATNGRRMTMYTTPLMDTILARVPAAARG